MNPKHQIMFKGKFKGGSKPKIINPALIPKIHKLPKEFDDQLWELEKQKSTFEGFMEKSNKQLMQLIVDTLDVRFNVEGIDSKGKEKFKPTEGKALYDQIKEITMEAWMQDDRLVNYIERSYINFKKMLQELFEQLKESKRYLDGLEELQVKYLQWYEWYISLEKEEDWVKVYHGFYPIPRIDNIDQYAEYLKKNKGLLKESLATKEKVLGKSNANISMWEAEIRKRESLKDDMKEKLEDEKDDND